MSSFDNAFINTFSNVTAAPQESELKKGQEDTPSTLVQAGAEATVATGHELLHGEREAIVTEKSERKHGSRRKGDDKTDGATSDKAGHFSCICDKDLTAKVRAIAWQEHLTVRAVVESMFSKCVDKYEKRHGPIQVEQRKSSEELF